VRITDGANDTNDLPSDFILDSKEICGLAVVSISPNMMTISRVDQLSVDTKLVLDPLDATFKELSNLEISTDILRFH
jgi:hypothetical protein